MKNIAIFFDCHGNEIKKYLIKIIHYSKICNNIRNINIEHILLNDYIVKGCSFYNNKSLDEKHIEKFRNTDVLILQVVEKDRGFLNNCEVVKYCKKDCIIIKIPHYRNSIYNHKLIEGFTDRYNLIENWDLPNKINNINIIDETKKIINNEIKILNNFPYDKNDMLETMKSKLDEFQKIDNLSDIKMLNYYNNNYKKYRLFMSRSYPSSRFFYELSKRILLKLLSNKDKKDEIKFEYKFINYYFGDNTTDPIPNYWYNFCKFEFDKTFITIGLGKHKMTECEWYYMLLLSKDKLKHTKNNINNLIKIQKSSN